MLWDQALSCWAATQVLLVCLLALTWMLPGSLLRYHEKIRGTVAGAVDVRAFCLSVGTRLKLGQAQGLMLGQMLAQELQGAVLTCWVMLSLTICLCYHVFIYHVFIYHVL